MKKNGFTLAEVLITLAIIGVVATMTLPALMSNTQEQQAKSALKKGINTLTEAAATAQAIDGIDFGTIRTMGNNDTADAEVITPNSFYGILTNRTQVDFSKTIGAIVAQQEADNVAIVTQTDQVDRAVILRDGSAILYNSQQDLSSNPGGALSVAWDGLPVGFVIVYDTNGLKQPNILSNCNGTAAGELENFTGRYGTTAPTASDDIACPKANRVIRDQFALRLRGTQVVPEGMAAEWAYNN